MQLYPAILTDSIQEAQSQLVSIASVPNIRTVQVDIIDGLFADNVTLTPLDLHEVDFGEMSCDLHLMTEEPLDFVYEAIDGNTVNYDEAKNDVITTKVPVRAIIGQIERMSNQVEFLQAIKGQNWQAGLSLDLYTPLDEIEPDAWLMVDIIQLMGIEAGFQGQTFNQHVFEKIAELQQQIEKYDRPVEVIVDGGLTPALAPKLQKLGVHGVAVGSSLWNEQDARNAAETYFQE
jgi:ribulose-phosphate 3-epimerase